MGVGGGSFWVGGGVGGGFFLGKLFTATVIKLALATYSSSRRNGKTNAMNGNRCMVTSSIATSKGAAGILLASRALGKKAISAVGGNLIGSNTAR